MDAIDTFWTEIVSRPGGPLAFRFYLQPAMAIFFAMRDGLRDARQGRPAYMWALFTNSADRAALLRDGWKSIRKIFIGAAAMDLIYQAVVLGGFRPIETLFIAVMLAIIPYAVVRGPIGRAAKLSIQRRRNSSGRRAA